MKYTMLFSMKKRKKIIFPFSWRFTLWFVISFTNFNLYWNIHPRRRRVVLRVVFRCPGPCAGCFRVPYLFLVLFLRRWQIRNCILIIPTLEEFAIRFAVAAPATWRTVRKALRDWPTATLRTARKAKLLKSAARWLVVRGYAMFKYTAG